MKFLISTIWPLFIIINCVYGNSGGKTPSCDLIRSMKVAVNHLLNRNGSLELLHPLVRFAFHNCVGGCNGCFNIHQPANAGLEDIFYALEEKYQKLGLQHHGISRADFWAFAGEVAVEKGASLSHKHLITKPCFSYQWGRHDCPSSPVTDEFYEFPGGHLTRQQMFSFFKRSFNFDEQETVAILGAHSLGGASPQNSGFDGQWTPDEVDMFDTGYYEAMLDPELYWENKNAGNLGGVSHWQWEAVSKSNETYFMLNTDFEIFFDLDLDANGKATCTLDTTCAKKGTCGRHNFCPKSETYNQGEKYIKSPDKFYSDFVDAYAKMVHNGVHRHLEVKGGSCSQCQEPTNTPSCDLIRTMRNSLLHLFGPHGGDEQQAALRMAFHTCIGGCHGCLNLNQTDNNGLQDIYQKLNELYQNLGLAKKQVSRADFWALAGMVAVEVGVKQHQGYHVHKPCFEYMWGRRDCATSPQSHVIREFPAGWMMSDQMFSFFKRTFKFSKEETVTIMGAHTIGEATKSISGFDGYWTPNEESIFNVSYYDAMIDPTLKWKNENAGFTSGHDHWQWVAIDPHDGEEYFMLNTDMELFFDIDLDGSGKATCVLDNTCFKKNTCGKHGICRKADTFEQAATYAMDNNAFYQDFVPVFTKMLHTGSRELEKKGGTCNLSCSR